MYLTKPQKKEIKNVKFNPLRFRVIFSLQKCNHYP